MEANFICAVAIVGQDQQTWIEESPFGFARAYAMFVEAFPDIAVIPLETDNRPKVDHFSILA